MLAMEFIVRLYFECCDCVCTDRIVGCDCVLCC